jgi:serine/threonine protein kinase
MADIFLAKSLNEAGIERYVVLKRVLAERSKDTHFAEMFLDEARLAAQLQHPNIAQVHDIGKLGGSYFYTMEYVHGEDVRVILYTLQGKERKLPVNLALHVASNALSGLHHAHTRTSSDGMPLEVVHRDVTPSNLMVSYEGAVKLLDFGVAKAAQRCAESRAGTIKGKIAYLSPEQCKSTMIDRRSDIYSLGIVLHEMLTGRRLYKRDTDFNTMYAITMEAVVPPSAYREGVSPALDKIVLTALEKDPARRYQSADLMIEAIEELVAAERHVLSVNSMSRFMRELFGERPQPWLSPFIDEPTTITVTEESIAGVDVMATTIIGRPPSEAGEGSGSDSLEAKLEAAPVLHRLEISDDSIRPLAPNAPPPPLPSPAVPPAEPAPAAVALPLPAPPPEPAPPPVVVQVPAPAPVNAAPPIDDVEVESLRSRPSSVLISGAVAAVIVVIVLIAMKLRGGDSDERATAPPVDAAVIAVARPEIDAEVVAVEPDAAEVPVVVDAAAAVVTPPDAAVVAPPPLPPKPLSIDEAFAKGKWAATLDACDRDAAENATTRGQCGIAACKLKRKSVALGYYKVVPKATQATIEKACSAAGISLAQIRTPPPPRDPCDDRKFAEANPLRCQK